MTTNSPSRTSRFAATNLPPSLFGKSRRNARPLTLRQGTWTGGGPSWHRQQRHQQHRLCLSQKPQPHLQPPAAKAHLTRHPNPPGASTPPLSQSRPSQHVPCATRHLTSRSAATVCAQATSLRATPQRPRRDSHIWGLTHPTRTKVRKLRPVRRPPHHLCLPMNLTIKPPPHLPLLPRVMTQRKTLRSQLHPSASWRMLLSPIKKPV